MKIAKFILFFILLIALFRFGSVNVYAQQTIISNDVTTKVGDPTGPPPNIHTPNAILANIVSNAAQIVTLLRPGTICNPKTGTRCYNVKVDEPGVFYWCTFLIIDSYNKAGLPGLTRKADGLVVNMRDFFKNTPGYRLLPPSTPVEQLRSGDTIVFQGDGQHINLIHSFELDQNGNGVIHTYDANNVVTEDVVYVVKHIATKAQTTSTIYSITGFGQYIGAQ